MQYNQKTILTAILAVVILGGGLLLYGQQKSINTLENKMNILFDESLLDDKEVSGESFDQSGAIRTSLVDSTHDIYGTIVESSNDFLVVEASIVDLEKLDDVDYSLRAPLPITRKKYKVVLDQSTQILSQDGRTIVRENLKDGINVAVFSKKPIYGINEFIAVQILITNVRP